MPKKGKKKNKRQQIEEDNDWDKSESEGEMVSTKDILKKNKKKKGGKNKNKKQQQSQSPSNDLDASDDESTKPVKQLSKKEKKKQKKMQKYQEDSPEPDWGEPEQEQQPPPQQQGKKKGKKGKKGKNKKQSNWDDSDEDQQPQQQQQQYNKNKKKNKKKKNKKQQQQQQQQSEEEIRAAKLLKLKEQRQGALLSLGNNLMLNLDVKYAPHFDDEMEEAWKATIVEYVNFYDEEDWEEMVEDEEILQLKKEEMKEAWNDIFDLIEQDYLEAEEERNAAQAIREKEAKLEAARAQGLNVGGSGTKQPTAAQLKAQKKREEREKLKALKKRLAEIDKIKVQEEQQKKEELEKAAQREKEEAEKKKLEELEKKKEAEAAPKAKNTNWDDSSSSDEDEEPEPVKVNRGRNRNRGKGNNKNNNKQKQKQQQKDALLDSSDDEWGIENKPKQQQQQKKQVMNDLDASDDEQAQNKQQKKKRGGRRRKKGGGNQQQNNNKQPQKGGTKQNGKDKKSESVSPKDAKVNKEQEEKPKMKEDVVKEEEKTVDSDHEDDHHNKKGKKGKGKKKGKKDKGGKKGKKVDLRSPICVVMGHVDTGKTKILDHIRNTSVQNKEAGGITQQIGATYLSIDYIKERTARLKEQVNKLKYKVPGLLFIDTPGHESFSNLRSRGSSMCDIAVLVVDLMHGLEPQTIESLNMLQSRKAPFVVALNKIDVCYDWKADQDAPFLSTYNKQSQATKNDFEHRLSKVLVQFAEQGINAQLYTKNKRMDRDISLVPTSAITGEGIPDLLYLIVQLTKKYMESKIAFSASNTKASVLEVKQTQGYGATIDVIVSNGTLRKDDEIVVCGMNGPIITPIRALLLPHEAQEMRVKGEYRAVPSVSASVGVRVAAVEDLSTAVAGAPLFVVPRNLKPAKMAQKRREVIEDLADEVQKSFADLFSKVDKGGRGVFVQASTLGSLEALIEFLSDQKIPISGIGIGTISKKTIMKASVMLNFQPEYAVILAFNVRCAPDARELAQQQGVRIFEAEIIYHLQEMFEEYINDIKEKRKMAAKDVAVFPVEFKILSPEHVFNNKNPLVLGVNITRGSLRLNTPIVAKRWNANKIGTPVYLGKVDGIKADDKDVQIAKMGDKVSVRIQGDEQQKNIQVGRGFDIMDLLISEITRDSLDALKANFKGDLSQDDIQHLGQLKKYFNII